MFEMIYLSSRGDTALNGREICESPFNFLFTGPEFVDKSNSGSTSVRQCPITLRLSDYIIIDSCINNVIIHILTTII